METLSGSSVTRTMANKVPEVTVWFWTVKVLSTTVGETAADLTAQKLGLGLGGTTAVMSVLLIASLAWQLRLRSYSPVPYWLTVVLISIVGTLVTDNLTDRLGVSLVVSTIVFACALALTLVLWYRVEGTLSMHSIVTTRREAFYWLTILFTFALGTAAGDLIAEQLGLGYAASLVVFAGAIAIVAMLHFVLRMGPVLSFWLAYVLTRPLGASAGDLLSQPQKDGGLGLGAVVTSVIFLSVILVLVAWLRRREPVDSVQPAHQRA